MSYNSDLTEEQLEIIKPFLPNTCLGRPMNWEWRDILNAIFYITRTGCQWRYLPSDFAPWQTVYYHFSRLKKLEIWNQISDALVKKVRIQAGKNESPSAAIIDSQSVKSTEMPGERGFDAGKKINGIKRHILVDTLGLIIALIVHPANIQDRDGAKLLLEKIADIFPRLRLIWADGGYAGKLVEWVKEHFFLKLDIVKRNQQQKGFAVIRKRWIVERTFGWLNRYRRLSKNYERLTDTSETMVRVAMINLMVRRLNPKH
jgi:putative transposase